MNNVHGFKSKALTELEPKQYTATNYLKNQLLFLKRISKELDPNTKAGMLVDAQIPNIEMALDELANG